MMTSLEYSSIDPQSCSGMSVYCSDVTILWAVHVPLCTCAQDWENMKMNWCKSNPLYGRVMLFLRTLNWISTVSPEDRHSPCGRTLCDIGHECRF